MSDWGPVFVAVVLFILLTPGLLVQIPGKGRFIEFGNFQTSGASILPLHNPFFEKKMADWAPVLIGVVLFVLLQPGLLFQLPGHNRQLEFGSMKTNGKAIAIHTLIFFAIYAILILALHVHIYTG
ncbi:hypothetical protein CFP56_041191 [Quercus suber]|uniref:Transmembrane protein n=1 Tax=Quercus suber TaxID=58331 RepID=A0AAW0IWT5_QUESU